MHILDAMAVMMESISMTVMARNTISAVYRVAQIVASKPNISYQNKAWLFQIQKYDYVSFRVQPYTCKVVLHSFYFGIGFS